VTQRSQPSLPFDGPREAVAPPSQYRFSAVDGRRGAAIDRLNFALDALLEEAFRGDGITLNNETGVSRGHYAKRLEVHQSYLCKACCQTLDKWDARLKEKYDGLSPTAHAFVQRVRSDSNTEAGIVTRRNRIFLKHYADLFGISAKNLSRSLGQALQDLEGELAGQLKSPERPKPTRRSKTKRSPDPDHSGGTLLQEIDSELVGTRRVSSSERAESVLTPDAEPGPEAGAKQAADLDAILIAHDSSPSGLHLTRRGKLGRAHYAGRLGVRERSLAPEARALLAAWDAKVAKRNGGLNPLARRFLDAVEADRASTEGIVTSERRMVDVPHYAAMLGASVAGIKFALGDQWPSISETLAARGELRTPLERKLLSEVAKDTAEEGRPKLGREGRINRRYYAERLGVWAVTLSQGCRDVLEQLDQEHGGASNAEARLDDMRRWLEDHYARRALPVRDGKIDRKLFQEAFALKGGTFMIRYPGIRALFDEFDARASAENYRSASTDTDLERLRSALEDDPDLNKDRLTVNRPKLEAKTGIPIGYLQRSPFIEAIRSHEAKILHRAQQSAIDPFISGRIFVFSDLPASWSRAFLTQIGAQFSKAFSHTLDRENLKPRYLAFYDLLIWFGTADNVHCRAVLATVAAGQLPHPDDWEQGVYAYRDQIVLEIKEGLRSKVQADGAIASIRRVLTHMDPVLPALQNDLPGIKYAKAFVVHRASVAEATPASQPGSNYIEFVNNMLRQAADRFKVDLDHDEAVRFTEVLATEMGDTPDLPSDVAHAILLVLNRRLKAIGDAAAAVMAEAREAIAEGERLLKEADIDASGFYKEYASYQAISSGRRHLLRQWFPSPVALDGPIDDRARRRSTANLLALAKAEFDGILPGSANPKAAAEVGQFFQKRYNELGTRERLLCLLNPSKDACGAALTLYLVESGANVAVGRTLGHDCLEDASQSGFKLITGHKARAKGKPIYAELPSDADSVKAVAWYAEHSTRYRLQVSTTEAKSLFLLQDGERCQLAPPHWYTDWFKKFASRIPALHQANVTPSMLRPSVLLKAALENDGRLQVGRAIGQHGQAVTRGYQEKLPVRMLRDQHMRRFQRHFETRVLQNAIDVAQSLGISAEEFDQRVNDLQSTGLGTFCADPYLRPGSEGQRCRTVDCWRECPQLLVVANVDAIALLQIWQASLQEAQGDWERDHPERWGDVWLPWLCLTEVVQKKMSRGLLLLTWRQAETRAAELRSEPNYVPPRPF
jgi:hypothetical protein